MRKTILVIGSNSFAGACLVDALLSAHYNVIGISRSTQPPVVLLAYANNPNISLFTFYQIDINHEFDKFQKLISSKKPDIIVDFAGQGMVAESWRTPDEWYTTNIVSKVKLHQYLTTCDFLEKYIRISTPEVYGSVDGLITEDQSYNPSTPYAVSHAAIDMSLMAFYKQYHFPVILGRFANFYGPHQQLYRIIPRAVIYALTDRKLLLHGGGHSIRSFIYGSDVSNAILQLISNGCVGEIYHFSGNESVSILELVKTICDKLNINYGDLIESTDDRPGKDKQYTLDDGKSKKNLQWKPQTTLNDGVDETIKWVTQHLDTIKKLPLHYIHKS